MVRAIIKPKYIKKKQLVSEQNHKLTEYFNIRKSDRRTKREVLEEKRRLIEFALRKGVEDGLEVKYSENKGRGVFATREFVKGEFVVEYSGELIDIHEAYIREQRYEKDENMGCYMYYFKFKEQHYCIDATEETGRLGRLVNHSRNGNLQTKTILVDSIPRLILTAKTYIRPGEELLYDYGDRSKESLEHHPWLAL
ncbi:N-lysine methyltransferase KMT5A-like isoform X1 [Diorhabda carinulata]|uniref:N-lysine methyltransferase KMT5A-like isoform X1 n=1 Tax=Diorhabda carinulata TaxID=1163345 RepID=UPI0025A0007F|nr:N-lysine methyltransferase KMT5A-like isoform X1 [Diorhabda carinulata]